MNPCMESGRQSVCPAIHSSVRQHVSQAASQPASQPVSQSVSQSVIQFSRKNLPLKVKA